MPKFGTVFTSLAKKAGINLDDENVKKFLAAPEVSNFDLSDENSAALEGNLLTVDSATANSTVRGKLFAEAMNGFDSELDKSVTDFGFDDTFKGEVLGIKKNTNEKFRKVNEGLRKQLEAVKKQAADEIQKQKEHGKPDDGKINALTNQIAQLNKQIENNQIVSKTEIENLKAQNLNNQKEFTLRSILAGKPLPKNGIPQQVNVLTAKTLLEQDMAKNGLVIHFDTVGNPIIKQRKDGAEIDFYVDNKLVDFDAYTDGVLASNKFVQINDQNAQQQQGGGNNQQQPPAAPNTPTNQRIASDVDSMLASLGMTV